MTTAKKRAQKRTRVTPKALDAKRSTQSAHARQADLFECAAEIRGSIRSETSRAILRLSDMVMWLEGNAGEDPVLGRRLLGLMRMMRELRRLVAAEELTLAELEQVCFAPRRRRRARRQPHVPEAASLATH